jgi:hypothetical protein
VVVVVVLVVVVAHRLAQSKTITNAVKYHLLNHQNAYIF